MSVSHLLDHYRKFILFIPFLPNGSLQWSQKKGKSSCYDWILRSFDIEVVGKVV